MESRIRELESEVDKLRYEIEFLKKINETQREGVSAFGGFINDSKDLAKKFISRIELLDAKMSLKDKEIEFINTKLRMAEKRIEIMIDEMGLDHLKT